MTDGPPTYDSVVEREEPLDSSAPWQRLSPRMIAVDIVRSALALTPAVVAFVLFDAPFNAGFVIPLGFIAVTGVSGAIADVVRWATTRYRVTDTHVERSTGLFVTKYRSIRRDRIRSIDLDARLRHRIAGLKVVVVGAGQQSVAVQSALSLDAVRSSDAESLRTTLLRRDDATTDTGEVLAAFRPWWFVYHLFGIWPLTAAAGLIWGGWWFLSMFGVDVGALTGSLFDSDRPLAVNVLVGFALAVAVGAVSATLRYFTGFHRFELARVPTGEGTALRTRHGLFRIREVNRDDARLRGAMVSEPVFWRWMGTADTEVVTTGLSIWSANAPASILPRGPVSVARRAAGQALDLADNPFDHTLTRHPRTALRRRLVWAVMVVALATASAVFLAWQTPTPGWVPWVTAASLPLALLAAWVAYRALGHAIVDTHLVARSGLWARRTVALQRNAVSTIIVRESLFQRRLGLRSVIVATAAGWGGYTVADLHSDEALEFARAAAPGLLDPFVIDSP